eukprot:scaffold1868_cov193-Cylindrotheca_fusiformis.AAC.16
MNNGQQERTALFFEHTGRRGDRIQKTENYWVGPDCTHIALERGLIVSRGLEDSRISIRRFIHPESSCMVRISRILWP